jgi:tyrosinase
MDRAWWSWQTKNLEKRIKEIAGPLVALDYTNQIAGNATLDDIMHIGTTVNVTANIRDVMHIQRGLLCYKYDTQY